MANKQLNGIYQFKQDTFDQMINEGTIDSSLYFVRDFDANGIPTSSSIYLGDRKYAQIYTIEGDDVEESKIPDIPYEALSWNIPEEPITVKKACEICSNLLSEERTEESYYVMGYISRLHYKHYDGIENYNNAMFYIKDAKSQDELLAHQVYGPNGQKIIDVNSVAIGDFVVLYGELTNYNGSYETVKHGAAYIWRSTNNLLKYIPSIKEEPILIQRISSDYILSGDGTLNNPYTTTDVIALGNTIEGPFYIKGFIIGQIYGQNTFGPNKLELSPPFTPMRYSNGIYSSYSTNLLISDSLNTNEILHFVPLQLPPGDIRSSFNLPENPDMLSKEIVIYGSLEKYFGVCGIKAPTSAVINSNNNDGSTIS